MTLGGGTIRHVSVTVPGTIAIDKPAPRLQKKLAQEIAETMTRRYGGATMTNATGYYMADSGAIIREPVIIVESYVLDNRDPEPLARTLAQHIRRRMSQESTLYTVDRQPRFTVDDD